MNRAEATSEVHPAQPWPLVESNLDAVRKRRASHDQLPKEAKP
jgi:hypothetical protein